MTQAARSVGVTYTGGINSACTGRIEAAHGYKWRYPSDEDVSVWRVKIEKEAAREAARAAAEAEKLSKEQPRKTGAAATRLTTPEPGVELNELQISTSTETETGKNDEDGDDDDKSIAMNIGTTKCTTMTPQEHGMFFEESSAPFALYGGLHT